MTTQIKKTIHNLQLNNMEAFYLPTRQEAAVFAKQFLFDNALVGVGGSQTLAQCGIIEMLRTGPYRFLDRYAPGLTREEQEEIFHQSFYADVYFSSSNAITENGELYNVDGHSNRVAALAYGPKRVVIVAGTNKLVKDIPAAIERVKTVSAPKNSQRLSCNTYCRHKNECLGLTAGWAAGCRAPDRLCCNYLVSGFQRNAGRIKVLLVGEELGY